MNKSLTAARPGNGRITTKTETGDLIATLPKWLSYLVGAFPAAQTNKMTFLAYETAFAETDPALMLAAVQAVAKRHKFSTFPTIAEIGQAVEETDRAADAAATVRCRHITALAEERHELLELAYAGEFDPAAWASLTSQYETAGFEFNAAWARRKVAQFAVAGDV